MQGHSELLHHVRTKAAVEFTEIIGRWQADGNWHVYRPDGSELTEPAAA